MVDLLNWWCNGRWFSLQARDWVPRTLSAQWPTVLNITIFKSRPSPAIVTSRYERNFSKGDKEKQSGKSMVHHLVRKEPVQSDFYWNIFVK